MRSIVPFAAVDPKTRLDSVLAADERAAFAGVMLRSVLTTLREADHEPTVLSTAPLAEASLDETTLPAETPVVVDDQPLTAAVNDQLATDDAPTLIVMADLPLATPNAIQRLTAAGNAGDDIVGDDAGDDDAGDDAEITIAPGLGGGTNALVIREPAFRVDYHGASYLDHCAAAADCDATVHTVDSRRLATDIDEPSDLAEVLIHGDGATREWLVDAGFELDTSGGRVGVRREK